MKKTSRHWISVVAFCIIVINHLWAQQPVTLSLFNESTTIPYTTFLNDPMHPGVQIGTEFDWKENRFFRLYPSVSFGYMYHKKLFQGLYSNLELGCDYKTFFGLNFKIKIGLGYLHTFSTQQEFQFDEGSYKSKRDLGNSRLMPSITTGLGFRLYPKKISSPEIYVLYQSWVEFPYSPGFIPLMSHTNLHIGIKFFPFNKKKKP
ncbi:hypothetical protein [Kriegella aquimaris]|uniref:Outer membrane protein beta-barrel domain-containing protein n=1 Tax=Kriegella aquimaris TaxID=192904 RepID=A0A1G9S8V9_9FLAO|nr:hypothetical protein [Kriegella aquimaris]SDM31918.1 hypothetical protein SAMN04488514_107167 [Kriegella aquimaris]